jgi:hypothetical protein
MSKNNNVNPGQYKVAGRERTGEDVVPRDHKARLTQSDTANAKTPPAKEAAPRVSRKTAR